MECIHAWKGRKGRGRGRGRGRRENERDKNTFAICTRPELVSVRNKSSNFSAWSSWRGLSFQFLLALSRIDSEFSLPKPGAFSWAIYHLCRRNVRERSLRSQKVSRIDPEYGLNCSSLPQPSFRFLYSSHSSFVLRFVKAYDPVLHRAARYSTEMYCYCDAVFTFSCSLGSSFFLSLSIMPLLRVFFFCKLLVVTYAERSFKYLHKNANPHIYYFVRY